jgi:hypothetical protein
VPLCGLRRVRLVGQEDEPAVRAQRLPLRLARGGWADAPLPEGGVMATNLPSDARAQTDDPYEPLYSDGAFHVEMDRSGWRVYDAYWNKFTCGPWDDLAVAIDACVVLSSCANVSSEAVDAAYERLDRWPA